MFDLKKCIKIIQKNKQTWFDSSLSNAVTNTFLTIAYFLGDM